MVFCHGIPGSRPAPADRGYADLAASLTGYACLNFNFEGCGFSGGDIDLRAWIEDFEIILKRAFELPGVDRERVHIVAFSAGGCVAARALSLKSWPVQSLLLLATPARLAEILPAEPALLCQHFQGLGLIRNERFPVDLEAWYKGFACLNTELDIAQLGTYPVGIVHGDRDETVPLDHANRLFCAAGMPKQIKIIAGAGHRLRLEPGVPQLIQSWLEGGWKA